MLKGITSSMHRGRGRAREGLGCWGSWETGRVIQRDSGWAPKPARLRGAWAKPPRALRLSSATCQRGWGAGAGQRVPARAVEMLTSGETRSRADSEGMDSRPPRGAAAWAYWSGNRHEARYIEGRTRDPLDLGGAGEGCTAETPPTQELVHGGEGVMKMKEVPDERGQGRQ